MTPQIAALAVARDALLEERFDACRAVLNEHDVDVEYVRCSAKRAHPRFYVDEGDPYEDEDEPLPLDEQRRQTRASWARIEWNAWRGSASTANLALYEDMLRALYPADSVATLAGRGLSVGHMLSKAVRDPDVPIGRGFAMPSTLYLNPRTHDDLVRRYAQLSATMPGYNAAFHIPGESTDG